MQNQRLDYRIDVPNVWLENFVNLLDVVFIARQRHPIEQLVCPMKDGAQRTAAKSINSAVTRNILNSARIIEGCDVRWQLLNQRPIKGTGLAHLQNASVRMLNEIIKSN